MRDQGIRNAFVGGVDESGGRRRKHLGLLAKIERRDLVVLLRPVLHQIPSHAVIDGERRFDAPTVLRKRPRILVASVEGLGICLVVIAGYADQKIREVRSRLGTGEEKRSVER